MYKLNFCLIATRLLKIYIEFNAINYEPVKYFNK